MERLFSLVGLWGVTEEYQAKVRVLIRVRDGKVGTRLVGRDR